MPSLNDDKLVQFGTTGVSGCEVMIKSLRFSSNKSDFYFLGGAIFLIDLSLCQNNSVASID